MWATIDCELTVSSDSTHERTNSNSSKEARRAKPSNRDETRIERFTFVGAHGKAGDEAAFDQLVRVVPHDLAILARARLTVKCKQASQ